MCTLKRSSFPFNGFVSKDHTQFHTMMFTRLQEFLQFSSKPQLDHYHNQITYDGCSVSPCYVTRHNPVEAHMYV